ncbi:MAG: hypothetical protein J2P30_28335 [Actinobacteria bacterium]|nr:hypothetical protein [Actinomycetota bacterium]
MSRLEKPGWNPDHGFGPAAADPREDLGVVFMTHTPSRIQQRYHQIVRALVLQALVA